MAEAVGLAASIAGLVSLAGQVFSGCVTLKALFDDTRNALEDIRRLHAELGILEVEVGNMSRDAEKMVGDLTSLTEDDVKSYKSVLDHCQYVVSEMTAEIDKQKKKVGGDAKWWDQIKIATRKKKYAEYSSRIERAKTQVLMVGHRISM